MSVQSRSREITDIELEASVSNTSGDAAVLGAHDGGPWVDEQDFGDYVYFYHAFEATEGKMEWQLSNAGIDLELNSVTFGTSQGAENNRCWLHVGRAPQGNSRLFQERILSNFGLPPGGSWARASSTYNFREDRGVPEYMPNADDIFVEADLSNPNNTDTTKVYVQATLSPWDDTAATI